jgi:hypothetical protein
MRAAENFLLLLVLVLHGLLQLLSLMVLLILSL